MNKSPTMGVFGYGSLVNKNTLSSDSTTAVSGRLHGWVRQWKHCVDTTQYLKDAFGKVCVLTVDSSKDAELDGILLLDSHEKLEKYDKREIGYKRKRIDFETILIDPRCLAQDHVSKECYVYVSEPQHHRWGNSEFPILRSYIDCVLAGFLEVYGREGIEKFIDSTEGWDAPILNDRATPIYPRAVILPQSDRQLIDDVLSAKLPHLRFIPITAR